MHLISNIIQEPVYYGKLTSNLGRTWEDESMAYRVLALTFAAGMSLSAAALAKEHCPVGEIYFRSKHTCVAKGTAIARAIYHYGGHIAAKADRIAVVQRRARVHAAAQRDEIPLPPDGLERTGMASTPARNETSDNSGSMTAPTPKAAPQPTSPYGALVPITPIE
jgi:hypothetical protein